MITFRKGDLFESSMQTLVNPVNCAGVMGKGLALRFKKRFPGLFESYVSSLLEGSIGIGRPTIWKDGSRWVVNFPTKAHWKKPSSYAYVEYGLVGLFARIPEWKVQSMALPALGCGLGGLKWDLVKPLMEKYLGRLSIPVEVYEPEVSP